MPPPPAAPFHNPFAQLAGAREGLPPGPPPREAAPPLEPKGPARAVVRMERKGRGGKEVTVVEGLGLRDAELEVWLKALKGSLGCGGTREEDALVLQGDQRERLPGLLSARGVRKVTVG
nr:MULTISPECIES: translation initiation factor [Myxococcaceae]